MRDWELRLGYAGRFRTRCRTICCAGVPLRGRKLFLYKDFGSKKNLFLGAFLSAIGARTKPPKEAYDGERFRLTAAGWRTRIGLTGQSALRLGPHLHTAHPR